MAGKCVFDQMRQNAIDRAFQALSNTENDTEPYGFKSTESVLSILEAAEDEVNRLRSMCTESDSFPTCKFGPIGPPSKRKVVPAPSEASIQWFEWIPGSMNTPKYKPGPLGFSSNRPTDVAALQWGILRNIDERTENAFKDSIWRNKDFIWPGVVHEKVPCNSSVSLVALLSYDRLPANLCRFGSTDIFDLASEDFILKTLFEEQDNASPDNAEDVDERID